MRRLSLSLNSSLKRLSDSCCSGPRLDGPGPDAGYGFVDAPGSDVDGPGGYGLDDGPGSDVGALGGRGGWPSVGPRSDRGRFKFMSKSPCRGGGLESCDGDELGDFPIAHISYHVQSDNSDSDSEPGEWEPCIDGELAESESSVGFDSWIG